MAEAYMAYRVGDSRRRPLVLKRIRPDFAESEEYFRRFVLEAQVASRLENRNLVRFREFGKVGQCHYIVMDMVHGWSLHRVLDPIFKHGTAPSLEAAVTIGAGILEGLAAMHAVIDEHGHPRPMLHRDVTPSNVILSKDGVPVIIDFGIAKDIMGPAITLPGRVIGTARYMAPEHRRAEYIDTRADVFSVSVILFELLTGRHPWPPLTVAKELLRITFDPPELGEELRRRVPVDLMEVVRKGLACLPRDRFDDAPAMSRALLACRDSARFMERGHEAVMQWVESLDMPLDEQLSVPVLDVAGTGGISEVMWTVSGGLTTGEETTQSPIPAPSEPLLVPPLPPRRDASLRGVASTDDELSPEMVAAIQRFSWTPAMIVIAVAVVLLMVLAFLMES